MFVHVKLSVFEECPVSSAAVLRPLISVDGVTTLLPDLNGLFDPA